MILDAYGHQYARSIGFAGGLREVPRRRRGKDTADAIAWASVELEETYEPIEECRNFNSEGTSIKFHPKLKAEHGKP